MRVAPTKARAMRIYPDAPLLQAAWRKAVKWMQSRPKGSIWIMDEDAPPPKWRMNPAELLPDASDGPR